MALYLGINKQKIVLDGVAYLLKLISKTITINNDRLLSSDNYILIDSNGLYLTVEEGK